MMKNFKLIDLVVHGDERGKLVALEKNVNCPFEIKRAYYIYDTQLNIERGFHAHKNLQQLCICVAGELDFVLDNGVSREIVHLNSPSQGLLLGNNIWREMKNFSKNCVVLVLASEYYNEDDYVRDYQQFLKNAKM